MQGSITAKLNPKLGKSQHKALEVAEQQKSMHDSVWYGLRRGLAEEGGEGKHGTYKTLKDKFWP